MKRIEQAIAGVCGLILLIVVAQGLFPKKYVSAPPTPPAKMAACIGTAIPIDVAYTGGVNEPWTCQVQCVDDQPRYILYSNGKATQCETPPGCNDTGEDSGVTCTPPGLQSTTK